METVIQFVNLYMSLVERELGMLNNKIINKFLWYLISV